VTLISENGDEVRKHHGRIPVDYNNGPWYRIAASPSLDKRGEALGGLGSAPDRARQGLRLAQVVCRIAGHGRTSRLLEARPEQGGVRGECDGTSGPECRLGHESL
jgi:hypothetical protein